MRPSRTSEGTYPLDTEPLAAALSKLGISLPEGAFAQLADYHQQLYAQNEVMNLTRISPEEAWKKQYLDAALLVPSIAAGESVLDLGTAFGVPAVVLAIFCPASPVTALDGSRKGLGLIESLALPNVTIVQARAESWNEREKFGIVTGRALAPLPLQLELSAAFAKTGGRVVPYRTPQEREEIESFPASQLGLRLESIVERPLDQETTRLFPIYRKVKATPKRYSRPWAEIRQRPLGKR